MSESTLGLMISLGISLATSMVFFSIVRSYLWACLAAVITSDILFHVVAFLYSGYWDPFGLISIGVQGLQALGVAVVVGLVFAVLRAKKNGQACEG